MSTQASMPRWGRVQALFGEAADLPASKRPAFLDEACAGDDALRREIEALLANDQGPELTSHSGLRVSVLTQAISVSVDKAQREQRQHLIGTTLGNYRLTSELGHGGAGTVYLGERADEQYSRKVAVKVLAYSLNEDIAYRFQAERYILAELTHPYIAKLFDAGETPDQQPYLVMEYVEGEPLDKYCDGQKLAIKERIQLFLKVCSAVHYAHQHLIVHRDLKPGNILVTADGTPKLLDFGIAKWLDKSRLPETSQALTRINDRVLTPEYASPEQVTGRPIATTSDVYTLGVVLYELLSGSRPYQLPTRDHLEVERLICILDPTSPSDYFSTQSDDDQKRIATLRGETPKSLAKTLHGDLDAILMRALRKEPTERYESVEQLTDDLDRYLNGAPVTARQGNWLYYTKRFVKRRRVGLSVAAAFFVCISAAATVITVSTQKLISERNNADHQQHKADTASNFWLGMFDRNGLLPNKQPDSALTMLDRAAEQIKHDTQLTPDIRAQLLVGMGKSYQGQGKPQLATPYLEEATTLLQLHQQKNILLLTTALESLGNAQNDIGEPKKAVTTLQQGLVILEKHSLKKSDHYYQLLKSKGWAVLTSGDPTEGERIFRSALILAKQLYGSSSSNTAYIIFSIGNSKLWQGNYVEAATYFQEAAKIYDQTVPESHPERINTNLVLAYTLSHLEKSTEAKQLATKQLAIQRRTFGKNSTTLAYTLDFLSGIEKTLGNLAKAQMYADEAVTIGLASLGENNPRNVILGIHLSEILLLRRDFKRAEKYLEHAIRTLSSIPTLNGDFQNDQYLSLGEYLLSKLYLQTERFSLASQILESSISRQRKTENSTWRIARAENLLAYIRWLNTHSPSAQRKLRDTFMILADPNNGALPEFVNEAKARTEEAILDERPTHQ